MNFELTEERQMLKDSVRRFLSDTASPEMLKAAAECPEGHSRVLWDGLVEIGLLGALFSEEVGGFGGRGFDLSVVFEELGRAGVFEPVLETGILAGGLISALGSPEQLGLIDDIIAGRIVVLAHAEPGVRYNLSNVATRAKKTEGGWTLNGTKTLVCAAASADLAIVSARVSGNATDRDGLALFFISPTASGVSIRSYPLNGGGSASEMTLTDVVVPELQRLGENGDIAGELENVHARASAAQCAEAVGLMDAIKDLTVDYLRTRKQFGQPIGKFQALQHRMADFLIEIEQARSASINLAGHVETSPAERDRHVSAAKNLIGRVSRLVVEESIQLHGGIGMTMEYALGHLAKRLTMVDHRFGDADWHLERFIRLSAAA